GVDYIDESEVLTPADEANHSDKWAFTTPFVCGATNLGEALRRNAFGRQNESFEAAVEITGIGGGPVEGVFIRAPWVESTGERTEVLARLDDGTVVAVRAGNLLATSFHPELTGDHRVHELFVDMVRAAG
ncbi:pyridoxal 5'-phosphate synthase glutaminase subunit PdxT, partial [Streptomyces sp. PH10-H1]|uniref:pyridoxal 5'-phosphate synthase glutaminase subunit PdxT n=1 Tax=Streptomyces sp. PH10-H1 TaxID=3046212 RepID=UPI0024B942D4